MNPIVNLWTLIVMGFISNTKGAVMTWKLGCAIALALMPGWALAQNSEGMAKSASKLIAARLVDPESIVLRNTRLISATSPNGASVALLCGEYNARNGFGGYGGFETFLYEPSEMQGVMTIGQDMTFMSQDGRNDFSSDASKSRGFGSGDPMARFNQLRPYLVTYLDACQKSI